MNSGLTERQSLRRRVVGFPEVDRSVCDGRGSPKEDGGNHKHEPHASHGASSFCAERPGIEGIRPHENRVVFGAEPLGGDC